MQFQCIPQNDRAIIYCEIDLSSRFDENILNNFSDLKELQKLKGLIKILIDNGSMNFEKLKSLPGKYFNKDISIIMKDLESGTSGDGESDCNNKTEDCLKQEAMAKLTYKMSYRPQKGVSQKFGSFLRNFVPIFFDNFDNEKYHPSYCMWKGCKKDLCKTMSSQEKYLHNYFANLSSKLNVHETISLFEIPSLFSYNLNIIRPKKPSFGLKYRCERNKEMNPKDFIDCVWEITKHIDTIVKGGSKAAKGN